MEQIASGHGHLSDPHRRWLRHTYQEGPGFLFLATRGGLPPCQRLRGGAAATVRERAHLLLRAIARVADELGNTPAVARKGYIHPAVIAAYLCGGLTPISEKDDPDPYRLSAEERGLLALLAKAA